MGEQLHTGYTMFNVNSITNNPYRSVLIWGARESHLASFSELMDEADRLLVKSSTNKDDFLHWLNFY